MGRATWNALLDELPRRRLGRLSREVPAFRTCGIIGYYLALVALFAGALVTGRSLVVSAFVALVCGLSFFAYAHLRRAVAGREVIVLLEHVWFAQAATAAALLGLGEPLAPWLDLLSPALALFLACGRVGCLMAGCCHGNPSSLGIVYPGTHAADGFARHLTGVRLFPVALVECAGLVLIGVTGFVALPFAPPGRVFLWLLVGYAVMRFGLEGIRGDRRPHFLGLSQARWMSLGEFALALVLFEHWSGRALGPREAALGALFAGLLAGCLGLKCVLAPERRLLARAHVAAVRQALVDAHAAEDGAARLAVHRTTTAGVTVTVSRAPAGWHAALSWRARLPAPRLLCELAAEAWPGLRPETGRLSPRGVLHVSVPHFPAETPAQADRVARTLFGHVVRGRQRAAARRRARAASAAADRAAQVQVRSAVRAAYFAPSGARPGS